MSRWFALFLVFAAIIIPGAPNRSWMPSFFIENPLLILAAIWLVASGSHTPGNLLFAPQLRCMTVPYSLLLGYLLLVTVIFTGIRGDLMRLPFNVVIAVSRIKPLLLLVVLFALIRTRKGLHQLGWLMILLIFVEFGVMFCQRNNLFGINSWLTPLYHGNEEKYGGNVAVRRTVGTIGNPNNVGTVLSLMATFAYASMIYGKKLWPRIIAGIAVGFALAGCIWLAKTRQGVICILVGCFAVQLISLIKSGKRNWGAIGMVFGLMLLMVFAIYVQADQQLAERFGVVLGKASFSKDSSLGHRLMVWQNFFSVEGLYVFIGRGIYYGLIDLRISTWDSGYLETIREVGFPGLTFMLVMQIYPAILASRSLRKIGVTHPDSWLHVGLMGSVWPILVLQVINMTWSSPRVMTAIVCVYALSMLARKVEATDPAGLTAKEASWAGPSGPVGVPLEPSYAMPYRGPGIRLGQDFTAGLSWHGRGGDSPA